MGKCQTAANEKWVSTVENSSDGSFTIKPESGTGDFDGVFDNGVTFTGKCRKATSNKPGKIRFTTTDGRTYVGILEDDKNIQGLRLKGIGVDDLDGGDEDWVAVKTTT